MPNGKIYKEITYIQDFSPNAKIVDLTETIHRICSNSKIIKKNDISVVLRFAEIDPEIISAVSENLSNVLEESKNNLAPLTVDNLELYLLPLDDINYNFKISIEKENHTFYFLKPYKKIKDLALDCSNGYSFGHNIFLDIPHELTHNALSGVIDQRIINNNYPRWFEEGIAEFNSIKVASKLNPCWVEYRESFTVPRVSLARKEVYPSLFKWGRNNKLVLDWLKFDKDPARISWNELALFGASYQIILNDFGKDNGTRLAGFFSVLQNYEKNTKRKLDAGDLLKLYKNFIGEEFGKEVKLSSQEEQTIIKKESDFLIQDFKDNLPSKNKLKRYKALSVLASTDQLFDDEILNILLARKCELEKTNPSGLDKTFLDLINTAFAVRLDNKTFKKSLIEKLSRDNQKKEDVKKTLNNIISNSNRP